MKQKLKRLLKVIGIPSVILALLLYFPWSVLLLTFVGSVSIFIINFYGVAVFIIKGDLPDFVKAQSRGTTEVPDSILSIFGSTFFGVGSSMCLVALFEHAPSTWGYTGWVAQLSWL